MSTSASTALQRQGQARPTQRRIGGTLLISLVWLGGVALVFPLAWSLVSSFRPDASFLVSPFLVDPGTLTVTNYQTALAGGEIWVGFKNTAIQVLIILATTLFFCPLAGYSFSKMTFAGRRLLFGLMMLTLFFVPITQYIPLLLEMNALGWVDSYQALVMPLVISSLGIFWMTGVIAGVPNELLHAARVDGCNSFGVWFRIVLPVIRPALVSLAVITFLTAYNDYFWPLLIVPSTSMQTVQVALATFVSTLLNSETGSATGWGAVLAASAIVFLPTVIVFLIMQRSLVRGLLQGSVKE